MFFSLGMTLGEANGRVFAVLFAKNSSSASTAIIIP
jgi:hypothetical protein